MLLKVTYILFGFFVFTGFVGLQSHPWTALICCGFMGFIATVIYHIMSYVDT